MPYQNINISKYNKISASVTLTKKKGKHVVDFLKNEMIKITNKNENGNNNKNQ